MGVLGEEIQLAGWDCVCAVAVPVLCRQGRSIVSGFVEFLQRKGWPRRGGGKGTGRNSSS